MANGKHAKRRLGGALVILIGALLIVGVVAGGAAFAAYRYDRANLDRILPGVRIDGVDVSGMTRDQAITAVQADASVHLSGSITVTASGKSWRTTPAALGQQVDVSGAVDRALALTGQMDLVQRVWHRLRREPVGVDIKLGYRSSASGAAAMVDKVARQVAVPPEDASINLVGTSKVSFIHAKAGLQIDRTAAIRSIRVALEQGSASVSLPVQKLRPKVTDNKLGITIVVRVDQNRLYLYKGFRQIRTYPVATAMAGFTTPDGEWQVVKKAENPTWYNPAPNGWGAGEPASIPPGPGNPLGTRALYLDAPDIRIHGTPSSSSIGTYASHGCIRMLISDSETLYPLVPVGARVIIAGTRPY